MEHDMSITDLIAALNRFDPDMEVRISRPTRNREVLAQTIDTVDLLAVGDDGNLYKTAAAAIYNTGGSHPVLVIGGMT